MQKNNPLRLVIDTNLWISFLISDREKKLDRILSLKNVRVLFSYELLNEITETVRYPRLRKFFKEDAIEEMLLQLEPFIEVVQTSSKVNICRDIKDNFLLSLSKDGSASFLLTGDKDLLILQQFEKTKIVTIADFLNIVKTTS